MERLFICTVGHRYGRLVCIETDVDKASSGLWRSRFLCDCGNEKVISNRAFFRVPVTKSCGCYQKQRAAETQLTHGMRDTKTYRAWCAMRNRCNNENNEDFHNYGGRGISVDPEWNESFEAFYACMGECPPGHSLDRIDFNGPYSPANCRWADAQTQQSNKRGVHLVERNGESKSISEWAREVGMKPKTALKRYKRTGNVEFALNPNYVRGSRKVS